MRGLLLVSLMAIAGCSMTPTQKKFAGFAAGVLIVGAIAAHDADNGSADSGVVSKPGLPCTVQPDGSCR